jgi:hypothetical protein
MTARISRARRAELHRYAHEVRREGQQAGWPVRKIAAAIRVNLPQILPLEAWRLAYGWSRPQTIAGIAALYESDGLAAPPLNPSMLCRWEHGIHPPGPEYTHMLCRLYQAEAGQLGLGSVRVLMPTPRGLSEYGRLKETSTPANRYQMTAEDDAAALAAVRESVQLALEAEGPSGGPLVTEQLNAAWQYYAASYSAFPPVLLAIEVHRTRALVTGTLRAPQSEEARTELRRAGGWLSALAGNLAFHLGDYPAAQIHLSTAARLGATVGDGHLTCWALGAQSMTARAQRRDAEALDLARQAFEYATTPLRRAQILAWAELPALARLGSSDAARIAAAAQDELAADPDGGTAGRFGFDRAELHLHIAEASLVLADHVQARVHALDSQSATSNGRPSWAAATLTLARAEAMRGQLSDAAALGHAVLDVIPADSLRQTSRLRLRALDQDLSRAGSSTAEVRDLTERLRALPPLVPVGRISDEPNGH